MKLTLYFLTFETNAFSNLGFGVTAWTEDDAVNLLKQIVFKKTTLPKVVEIKVLKDLADLEQNHILPNIGNPAFRGVWYPNYRSEINFFRTDQPLKTNCATHDNFTFSSN